MKSIRCGMYVETMGRTAIGLNSVNPEFQCVELGTSLNIETMKAIGQRWRYFWPQVETTDD